MKRPQNPNGFIANFKKSKAAVVALILIIVEILAVFLLPLILNLDPNTTDRVAFNAPPSDAHILGTDDIGRDVFARILSGGQVSLTVGVFSTIISMLIGIPLGLLAGYYRGKWETIIMRLADVFMSFPSIVLILVLVAIFGGSITTVILVIGGLGWTGVAKLIYANTLSVRQKEYVEAAKSIGMKNSKIMIKYILPNVIAPVWVTLPFMVSQAIMTEASLSFLGMGVKSPQASWGNIINAAQKYVVLTQRPWIWVTAGAVLIFTVVVINILGEGIRDAFDPKMKR